MRPEVSFWWDDVGGLPRARPGLPGALECDVAVVGAGYTGLWTAYELVRADPSLRVVVLEREAVGFGASGRNGGWLSGELAGSPARWGPGARALLRAVEATVGEVAARVGEEGIACDLQADGALFVATSGAQLDRLGAIAAAGAEWGLDLRALDPDELAARVRVAGARGALWHPHCARVHPAKLVAGLASATERRGVRIFEGTEVVSVAPGFARTAAGDVRARWVVVATEGYTPGLPGRARALAPLNSAMVVTEPLGDDAWAAIGWRGAETLMHQAHLYCYLQRTADGRIAIGGRGVPYRLRSRTASVAVDDATVRELLARLGELFGVLAGARAAAAWNGVLGVARDWMPVVVADPATGVCFAGGYAGEGVAAANLAGRTLRDLLLGRDTELTRLPWVGWRSPRWEPEPLRWLGIRGVYALYRAADAAERRRGRPSRWAAVADRIAGR